MTTRNNIEKISHSRKEPRSPTSNVDSSKAAKRLDLVLDNNVSASIVLTQMDEDEQERLVAEIQELLSLMVSGMQRKEGQNDP